MAVEPTEAAATPDLRHPLPLSRRPINSKLLLLLLLLLGGLRQAWLSTRRSIPSTLLPAPLPVQVATRTHTHRHRHPHPRMASAVEVKAEGLLLVVAWQREECTHRHHRRGYRHRQALSKVSLQLTRPNHSSVRPYTAPLRICIAVLCRPLVFVHCADLCWFCARQIRSRRLGRATGSNESSAPDLT